MLRVLFSVGLLCGISASCYGADAAATLQAKVQPILTAHCVKCHGADKPEAKLNLAGPHALAQLRGNAKQWFRVLEQIESGAMPPEDEKRLSPAEIQTIAQWVRGDFRTWLLSLQQQEGRSKFRRFSRNEYANTIQDLFGFRPPVGRDLPSDNRVDGYDKISTALPLSAAGAEGYAKLGHDVASGDSRIFRTLGAPGRKTYRLWAGKSEQSAGHILELEDGITKVSFNTDTTSGPLVRKTDEGKTTGQPGARIPGLHHLKMSVYGYQTDQPLAFGIYAGHVSAYPQLIDLRAVCIAPPGQPTIVEADVYLRTRDNNDLAPVSDGIRLIPFGIGVQVPKNTQAKNCKGPGLAIQWIDVEEPETPLPGDRWLTADIPPELLKRLVSPTKLSSCPKGTREEFLTAMQTTFQRIGRRLFRRELTEAELATISTNLAATIDSGKTLDTAFRETLESLLTAPDFLCVIETPGKLSDYALASRLAYFLWNSTPDEELLEIARQGRLQDSQVLREQTERLLKDPKSDRFVNDFVDQWLGLRMINDTTPDSKLYPEYDDLLKISSVMETQATFRRMVDQNLSVRDFVAPQWALVNERLAKHYGLPGVQGFPLQLVQLPADSAFGGLWTQAATMKVTANGTNTSPVKRGVWVAERLLGTPIPPPPPNIEPINPDTRNAKTLREQLALHSSHGSCAACHAKFDPYGFALESFDVTGAFRTHYRESNPDASKQPPAVRQAWRDGLPVDSSGKTPDGIAFAGVQQLRLELAKNPEALARGVTRHLLTYATGTAATQLDQPVIEGIAKQAATDNYGLRSLVHGVVQSELFRSK